MPARRLPPPQSPSGTLHGLLIEVLSSIRSNPECFPQLAHRTRIVLRSAAGEHLEIEIDGTSAEQLEVPAGELDPAHLDQFGTHALELEAAGSIDDLGLGASAKAAAEKLLAEFPNDVKFTSGKRSIGNQASAMAPNVVKNRKWIEETYKDTPQRAALQKWVDDHPDAKTAAAIAAGLEGVMNGWTDVQKRTFSRHITGDAFDVQPVAGATGKKIKEAIAKLPKLNWHTFSEGGLEIWHAQFDA